MLHKEEERIHIRFEECHTRDIWYKIFNTCVALPHILLETIITYKNHHMQENEKSKQKKEKRTKQFIHKYEICLMEMI